MVEAVVDLKQAIRERLLRILGKHVTPEDSHLSDRELVEVVVERFRKYNDHYLVDVNE